MADMKVSYEIDAEEVVDSLRCNEKAMLADKLADECLSAEELIEIAHNKATYDEILDCIDDDIIVNYMIDKGYKVED